MFGVDNLFAYNYEPDLEGLVDVDDVFRYATWNVVYAHIGGKPVHPVCITHAVRCAMVGFFIQSGIVRYDKSELDPTTFDIFKCRICRGDFRLQGVV